MVASMVVMFPGAGQAASLDAELSGRILLQVEEKGEAWYIAPADNARHYLGRPADAFSVMRELGTGINERDYKAFKEKAPARLSGKILLRVEEKGEAYYVNPINRKLYYLGRPADAFNVMRGLGLGITNKNLKRIKVSQRSRRATPAVPAQPQDSPAAAVPATPAVPAQPQDSPAAVVPGVNLVGPSVVFEVATNDYPDHEDYNLSQNIPYSYINVYTVDPLTYYGTLKEIVSTGASASASVVVAPGEIIDFLGFQSHAEALAQTAYNFGTPPYKNFGQIDRLCQINYHNASQYLQNSADYACATSLSIGYTGSAVAVAIPDVIFEVAVNDYPDHQNNNLSQNITYSYVNVYSVDPATYEGVLLQTINTGSNARADVTVSYGEIVNFIGYKTLAAAAAQTTYTFNSPPYKNFGQVDQLCQTNYHVGSEYLNNSVDYACATSLSTPYQDVVAVIEPVVTESEPVVTNNHPTWGWKKATSIDDAYNFINGFAPYTEAKHVGDIAWSNGSFYIFYRGDMTGTADWGWKVAPDNDDLWNFLNREAGYTGDPIAEAKVVATDTADYVFYRGTDVNASWGWKRATDIGDMYNFVNGFSSYNQSYWGDMAGTEADDIDMYYNVAEEGDSLWGWKLAQTTTDAYDFLNRINAYDATYGYIHRINVVTDENGWFYIFYNKNE